LLDPRLDICPLEQQAPPDLMGGRSLAAVAQLVNRSRCRAAQLSDFFDDEVGVGSWLYCAFLHIYNYNAHRH
jgi:hypothetical protein